MYTYIITLIGASTLVPSKKNVSKMEFTVLLNFVNFFVSTVMGRNGNCFKSLFVTLYDMNSNVGMDG